MRMPHVALCSRCALHLLRCALHRDLCLLLRSGKRVLRLVLRSAKRICRLLLRSVERILRLLLRSVERIFRLLLCSVERIFRLPLRSCQRICRLPLRALVLRLVLLLKLANSSRRLCTLGLARQLSLSNKRGVSGLASKYTTLHALYGRRDRGQHVPLLQHAPAAPGLPRALA